MNTLPQRVAIAGASGYLGKHLTRVCCARNIATRIIVRDAARASDLPAGVEIVEAQATLSQTLESVFDNVDVVISALGITRQKDGLTYMNVDFQANVNLIEEAKRSGVKKFIYVSVLNGETFKQTKICYAKEALVDYLKQSGMAYTIVRPNGFFSDMQAFLDMAKTGKVYLFGDGKKRLNPIHGEDLATVIVNNIDSDEAEINVGGPDVLSQNDIAKLALTACHKPVRIIHIPDWIRKVVLWGLRHLTPSTFYGPLEFFMTTMVVDMVAPQYGYHSLSQFFESTVNE